MNAANSAKPKKEKSKKLSGWIIALIVAVVIFAAGGICCYAFGPKTAAPQATVGTVK